MPLQKFADVATGCVKHRNVKAEVATFCLFTNLPINHGRAIKILHDKIISSPLSMSQTCP